jgi:hypothetical protein
VVGPPDCSGEAVRPVGTAATQQTPLMRQASLITCHVGKGGTPGPARLISPLRAEPASGSRIVPPRRLPYAREARQPPSGGNLFTNGLRLDVKSRSPRSTRRPRD